MGLFSSNKQVPLAWRMQPKDLDSFVGQVHLLGPGRVLRRAIEEDAFVSLILYGPAGTGKTALARIIAGRTKSEFLSLNAVTSGLPDIRKAIQAAGKAALTGRKSILFIDEIHRFNKIQQDALLPEVEQGVITLIGASTENPFFALVPPLASRSMIFQFRPLENEEIMTVLSRALSDSQEGLGGSMVRIDDAVLTLIASLSGGDARKALNALEFSALAAKKGEDGSKSIDEELVKQVFQRASLSYGEDAHYDTISAFIKSMRGSDPDATVYWLARMLESGEDPLYIARRMIICASEDVGNADPRALVLAAAASQAAREVGMPEARIPLVQAAAYIATAPKSNSAIKAIDAAISDLRSGPALEVPTHLRDAHYPGAKRLGAGEGYKYPHNHEGHYVPQDYIPKSRQYYHPSNEGFERLIKRRMNRRHNE